VDVCCSMPRMGRLQLPVIWSALGSVHVCAASPAMLTTLSLRHTLRQQPPYDLHVVCRHAHMARDLPPQPNPWLLFYQQQLPGVQKQMPGASGVVHRQAIQERYRALSIGEREKLDKQVSAREGGGGGHKGAASAAAATL
jgi:hypothetical protein